MEIPFKGLFAWRRSAPANLATRLEGLKHSPPLHAIHVTGTVNGLLKVHLTPKLFFGRDETVQHSHKEFDNFISIWYF